MYFVEALNLESVNKYGLLFYTAAVFKNAPCSYYVFVILSRCFWSSSSIGIIKIDIDQTKPFAEKVIIVNLNIQVTLTHVYPLIHSKLSKRLQAV